jgi:hypothetical protein
MFNPADFPNLLSEGFVPRSPVTPLYNCIAWAAGESHRWWDVQIGYYWPIKNRSMTLDVVVEAFATRGFEECDAAECKKPQHEPSFQRIAIYTAYGLVKHAARQKDALTWTSKMGKNIDLDHKTLQALEGPAYGWVAKILKRPIVIASPSTR